MPNTEFDITAISNDLTIDLKLNTTAAIAWVKANMQIIPDMQKSESEISFATKGMYAAGVDPFVKAGLTYELDGVEILWNTAMNMSEPKQAEISDEDMAMLIAEGF